VFICVYLWFKYYMKHTILLFSFLFLLTSCADTVQEDEKPQLSLKAERFSSLPGWGGDDLKTFSAAFQKSCDRIAKIPGDRAFGPLKEAGTHKDWQKICFAFNALTPKNQITLQAFFENNFIPYQVRADNEAEGLFTGYYEASLNGSRTKSATYNIPLHTRPDDLVMVQLGEFRDELKGKRIAGRVVGGNLKPYESREEIIAGDWPHNDEILLWVDDPVDAFFVQIQGSGLVQLNDGSTMRIGYAGQNGHPYYAIGRELIKRGQLSKETVSMQSIRSWLAANPSQADEIMNTNRSYVFFREIDGSKDSGGPIGGQGVSLTAGRSLAIDRSLISYGLPIWTDIAAPVEDMARIQRLMVTQDTGGAIRGPVRGDVFWGYGDTAEHLAGKMRSRGEYWLLLPK